MLDRHFIEHILDYSVSCGADYAEVFFEDTERTKLTLTEREVTKCTGGRERGIGIRIFRGNESSYLYSADVRETEVLRLLEEQWGAWKLGFPGEQRETRKPLDVSYPHNLGKIEVCPGKVPPKEKLKVLQDVMRAGLSEDSRIVQGQIAYTDTDQRVQIANTEGTYVEDRRTGTRVRIDMTAEGPDRQTGVTGPGAMCGAEFLEKVNLEAYAREASKNAVSMLGARACPVGRMPVIIANGFGGLFFHEACGHSLEGSAAATGCSEFAGKLGGLVASPKVTLVDNGCMPGEWGSLGVDDEGIPTQKNVLIEKGILKSYLLDRLSARRMGLAPTGSARRESYRFAPVPRMTNTYIEPGEDSFEEMLRTVDKGLFVKGINAGSVDPVTGEFNFNTEQTYLIEHGEITVPLTSATLVGTGGDILPRVDMVSGNFALDQGYCYAGSGQLRIGAGQPAVRITEMTVGGKAV